jgi:hypothetical protein
MQAEQQFNATDNAINLQLCFNAADANASMHIAVGIHLVNYLL